jgi:bifunctional DNA-binding transcriptional regulator/antitoxin component of YhaV-PrlF toxin-antitoxin module
MSETKPRRRRGYTRLSSKRQVTIPVTALARTGLEPGDELKVEVDARGRIILTPSVTLGEQRRAAIAAGAGKLSGVYPPGYLDRLRDEWR